MSTTTAAAPILRIDHVSKTYPRPESGGSFTVLEDVSIQIYPGEIVALLGRSGSGKSTLLRSVAGLIQPTRGSVYSGERLVTGPNPDISMVFQSFALLPWLTVVENVEIGLEALHLEYKEARKRAMDALRLVGLEGFERAYPRELSGGMQQRVGFARAFVIRPRVLLLDEPFSALDVLTTENLRGEISDLWEAGNFPAESVLIVTHNIEEAIMLADRMVIMGTNPGRIRGEIAVHMPRPRERNSRDFRALADHVYTVMTNPETKVGPQASAPGVLDTTPLPHARPGAISGLLELVEEYGGPQDVAVISEKLRIEADDLLPTLDAAVLLGFAKVEHGDVTLTDIGRRFVHDDPEEIRTLFRNQALELAPLVRCMLETLKESKNGSAKKEFFIDILDENYSEGEAEAQFDTAVTWGRFAGLFDYHSDEETLSLHFEHPAVAD